jgi:hypothetical protein
MKEALLLTLLLLMSVFIFSQEGSVEKIRENIPIQVNGKLLLANAGFAPIPAFSFNQPLLIASLSIKNRQFRYDPDFSIGLNGKPWMANNWFRFTFMDKKKIRFNAGINPSLFFKIEEQSPGEETYNALRNLTGELGGEYALTEHSSINLLYMHIHAFDKGALSGNFIDISVTIRRVAITNAVFMELKPELFYFDFRGNVDGFFSSASLSISHRLFPLSVYFQGVQPVWSNFPGNHFKWNTGLFYSF